jgi:hypothetical protein
MEIIAITGILGSLAVIALVILRPWDGLDRMAAVYLFFTYRPYRPFPRHAADPRTAQQVWDDGPVPPIGSMSADAEREYRTMAALPERPRLADELRDRGLELDARGAAQRGAWAEPEPRPELLLPPAPPRGPERPSEPPWPDAQPPGPAERTDGASVPPGAWLGQFGALADSEPPAGWVGDPGDPEPARPEPPYPLPCPPPEGEWLPRPLPPWATDGGAWRIPAEAFTPGPPEPELPPSGDWAPGTGPPEDDGPIYRPDGFDIANPDPPGTVVIGPGADLPEPEPPEPSRLADPGELFRAELASEVLADMRARDADTARYLDGQAADLATTLNVMLRGY